MVKKEIKIYLEEEELKSLNERAKQKGFSGRGCLSHYISLIANNQIIFASDDVKAIVGLLNIKTA
jgi:hypothetical protein